MKLFAQANQHDDTREIIDLFIETDSKVSIHTGTVHIGCFESRQRELLLKGQKIEITFKMVSAS